MHVEVKCWVLQFISNPGYLFFSVEKFIGLFSVFCTFLFMYLLFAFQLALKVRFRLVIKFYLIFSQFVLPQFPIIHEWSFVFESDEQLAVVWKLCIGERWLEERKVRFWSRLEFRSSCWSRKVATWVEISLNAFFV